MTNSYDLLCSWLLKSLRNKVANIADINEQNSIIEIASGTGEQALLFAQKGAQVIGTDISEKMLEITKQKNKYQNLDFMYADATNLPFPENQFDISTTTLCLHSLDSVTQDQIITEMIRVTKTDGTIILADYVLPVKKTFSSTIWKLASQVIERFVGGEHYQNFNKFIQVGGLQTLVKKHNFLIEEKALDYGQNIGVYKLIN